MTASRADATIPTYSGYAGVTPEAELLLISVACGEFDDREARARRLLEGGIEWSLLLAWAYHNRAMPNFARFVGRLVERDGAIQVPRHVRELLDAHHRELHRYNLFLTSEILAVVDALSELGIDAIVYKGPVLASMIFGDVGARQFNDVDMLVPKEAVASASRVLIDRGYRNTQLSEVCNEAEFIEQDCEYTFAHRAVRATIELHWQLFDRPNRLGLDAELVGQHVHPVDLLGRQVLTFTPELYAVYLCAHGGEKHEWSRVKWLADVAHFLTTHPDLDVDLVLELAERVSRRRTIAIGAGLAKWMLGARLPAALDRVVAEDSWLPAFCGLARGRQFREDRDFPGFGEWQAYMIATGLYESADVGLIEKARRWCHYLRALNQPRWHERRRFDLPAHLDGWHRVSRPVELARRYKGELLERLR